jgi:hypothetical protein
MDHIEVQQGRLIFSTHTIGLMRKIGPAIMEPSQGEYAVDSMLYSSFPAWVAVCLGAQAWVNMMLYILCCSWSTMMVVCARFLLA